MHRAVRAWLLVTGLGAAAFAGCGGEGGYNPLIDPADFVAAVTNPSLPLAPGTRFVYEGESDGEAETVTVIVAETTRSILGVACTEVRDTVEVDGELVEDTLDWYAQDEDGNVWYFGEDVKNYENGVLVSTDGSWLAGRDGAKPGIIMQAHPQVGQTYRQEYFPGEAEDMARVLQLDGSASVPYGDFEDCLVTEEWTPLEPGHVEHKYYARDVGFVYGETVQGGPGSVGLSEVTTP